MYRLARNMTLPLPLLLAARYLKSTRRDAFVTVLSLLAVLGIALGVTALILVLSLLAGLQDFLRRDVLARTPHLEIAWPVDVDPEALAARIREVPGVVEAHQILRGRGWLLSGERPLDVEVVGYEGELPRFFPGPSASGREPGLYVDQLTAGRWGLEAGDLVEVVSPRPTLTPFGPQPRIVGMRLAGTFESGRTEGDDHRLAVPLATARRLFGDRQTRLEVRAESFEAAIELAPRLAPLLPPGTALKTWQELNRGLFLALRLEKVVMFVAVFLIVLVATLPIVTVLGLLISAKRGEIGMLQAMGAPASDLRRAFLLLGCVLGASGLALGGAAGVALAWLLDRWKLVRPPGDVYFIDHLPFLLELEDLAAVVAVTVALVLGSAIYAAKRAASTRAVEALKL
ncbi:MAG TPA: FtsX-like permease family protein [Thermoanaerobaculia bacterium]